jgi:outer membrane protein
MAETPSGFSIFSSEEVFNYIIVTNKGNKTVKKYFILILIACGGAIFAQTQKVGYVDSQIILTQLPDAIKAQGDLDALTNLWSNQIDSMKLALQQQYTDYQKQAATMTEEQKQTRQQEIVASEQQIYTFQNQKFGQPNGEIFQKQEEIFEPVKTKIYGAIEQVAQDEQMHFVFDKSGDVILLYADSAFDITFKVLDKLKRGK